MDQKKNEKYKRIDKLIIYTLCDLIKTMPENDISISLNCEKSGINRSTFYKHYKGIWGAIDKLENIVVANIVRAFRSSCIGGSFDVYAFI